MDEALAHGEMNAALRAWDDEYRAAVASGRWEGLVEAGDAYRRIGEVAGLRQKFDARAHDIYVSALFFARRQYSLEGVLRVAEAFVALGDREAAEESLRIARALAPLDPEAKADPRAFTGRFADEPLPEEWAAPPSDEGTGRVVTVRGHPCRAVVYSRPAANVNDPDDPVSGAGKPRRAWRASFV